MGVEGCGVNCAKFLLVVFNIIFFLCGGAFLGVGIWIITDSYKPEILGILDNPYIGNASYILIGIGAFIFLLAGFGLFGACCENRCLLVMYFFILLIILLAQIAIFIVLWVFLPQTEDYLTDKLVGTMSDYEEMGGTDTFSAAWDAAQYFLECCGTNSYADWNATDWYQSSDSVYSDSSNGVASFQLAFPVSCCKVDNPLDITSGGDPEAVNVTACIGYDADIPNDAMNQDGCYSKLRDLVTDNIIYVASVGIAIAVLEICGLMFTCIIIKAIGKNDVEPA